MGLGDLGAGNGDLLDGKEGLAISALHQIPGGAFAQARDGHEGRQNLAILDKEFGGVALININGREFKAPEVEFVDHFQGGQQVFILGGGLLYDGFPYCLVQGLSPPGVLRGLLLPPEPEGRL